MGVYRGLLKPDKEGKVDGEWLSDEQVIQKSGAMHTFTMIILLRVSLLVRLIIQKPGQLLMMVL